jgi:GNAT superfamily N-acetyltransferase
VADGTFREATLADLDEIVSMARTYYAEDGYDFDEKAARSAISALIADASLGWVWVIEEKGSLCGYMAVTLGYSLEYRGRDAFLDELYLLPGARGRGLGARAVVLAEETCRRAGVHALHLEVEKDKPSVQGLYGRAGFEAHDRVLMTKRLE